MNRAYRKINFELLSVNYKLSYDDPAFLRLMPEAQPLSLSKTTQYSALIKRVRPDKKKLDRAAYRVSPGFSKLNLLENKNSRMWEIPDRLIATLNLEDHSFELNYYPEIHGLESIIRYLLKWWIVSTQLTVGHIFLHASAAHKDDKVILFSGHSGCGKTSCLFRILIDGWNIITDDTFLASENGIACFDTKPTIRSDAQMRFARVIKSGFAMNSSSEITSKPDLVVLPAIKKGERSNWEPIVAKKAIASLWSAVQREILFNLGIDLTNRYQDQVAQYLSSSGFFAFQAGNNERHAQKVLTQSISESLPEGLLRAL